MNLKVRYAAFATSPPQRESQKGNGQDHPSEDDPKNGVGLRNFGADLPRKRGEYSGKAAC